MRWCLSALVEVSLLLLLLLWRVTPSASGILDRTCGVWELSMSMVLRHVEVSRFVCMCDWLLFFQHCLCGRLRTESMCGHSSCSGYKHWPLTTLNMHWTDETEMDRWMVAVSGIYLMDLFVSTPEQQKSQEVGQGEIAPYDGSDSADGTSKCHGCYVSFWKSEGEMRTAWQQFSLLTDWRSDAKVACKRKDCAYVLLLDALVSLADIYLCKCQSRHFPFP